MKDTDVGDHRHGVRRFAIVSRALFIYLLSAWLLARYFGPGEDGIGRSLLPGIAIVAGFPVAALLAMRFTPLSAVRPTSIWLPIIAAAGTALLLPVTCLNVDHPVAATVTFDAHSPAEPILVGESDGVTPVRARALADAHAANAADGLRLRIRGLSVEHDRSTGGRESSSAAEILLNTAVRGGEHGEELVITVSLVDKENDEVVWSRDYVGDPSDMLAVRRLIIRALSEAMGQTREGLSGGQFV
jgi:hypothetical protein